MVSHQVARAGPICGLVSFSNFLKGVLIFRSRDKPDLRVAGSSSRLFREKDWWWNGFPSTTSRMKVLISSDVACLLHLLNYDLKICLI
jgi:hypothetical protein